MKKHKPDIRQLEINFLAARDNLLAATDSFVESAKALQLVGKSDIVESAAKVDMLELRKRLCKVVKVQALTKRLTPREIWIVIYNRLLQATGYNTISRSIAAGDRCHLDAAQRDGYLPQLLDLAAKLN